MARSSRIITGAVWFHAGSCDRLEALREADAIVREGKRAYDWPLHHPLHQHRRRHDGRGPELDWALLKRIMACITAEAPGICRVCYDLTPKPAGTVEWEWRELASELAF